MALFGVRYGRVVACLIITLIVGGVFYLWLAGSGSVVLTTLIASLALAATCVGFTWWSLGWRLTGDE
ncbi:MAG: hypothetical protein RMN25_00480 [Anaerolineae bacterium]|nr:hypothetical protein [Thermoflexales bacterium]MDW8406231.1 hypothetical protein [Anaerolineae bacterium]